VEPDLPAEKLTPKAIGQSVNLLLPEGAIVVDEGATAGLELFAETAGARQRDVYHRGYHDPEPATGVRPDSAAEECRLKYRAACSH
jgi:hypothetical protein